jgi:hypothetical protein
MTMPREQNSGQNHSIKVDKISFESVGQSKTPENIIFYE